MLSRVLAVVVLCRSVCALRDASPNMTLVPNVTYVQGFSVVPLPGSLTGNGSFPNRLFGSTDESPYVLRSTASLYVSTSEITNLQYEAFDPAHAAMRGKYGFSVGDDEAVRLRSTRTFTASSISHFEPPVQVVFVTLWDAIAYTAWLSQANATYRLPTEGEAEAIIRAGTSTYFNTGDSFTAGNNQCDSWWPAEDGRNDPCTVLVNLTVCAHGRNAYDLCDTHGNVEEMTSDWYSDSYAASPDYPLDSTFKVTRGGSHSSDDYYLRSASRAGMLPSDTSWYVGFRVVREVAPGNRHAAWRDATTRGYAQAPIRWSDMYSAETGELKAHAAANAALQRYRSARAAAPQISNAAVTKQVNTNGFDAAAVPVWLPPLRYVHVDTPETIPYTTHNHDPALVACPNGDILATWFSTITESGRESGIVTSRLTVNATAWPPARLFWKTPARMDNAPLMHYDAITGLLFHVHGMAASATWGANAVVMRVSTDCGITWVNSSTAPATGIPASPSIILPEHRLHHQPVNTFWRTRDGAALVFFADNVTVGTGGTSMHASFDNGSTWSDTWDADNEYILGIHGTAVELLNGSILAFGRGNDIDGNMAQSRSDDFGATWVYLRSPWPGIHGGQRASHLRTQEGSLLFCGFANTPVAVATQCGTQRNVTGLFCASSDSEGNAWEHVRGMNDDGYGSVYEALDAGLWLMTSSQGEPNGYTAAAQGPDGMLHLISSRNHYRFNLAWLQSPPPC